MTPFKKQTDGLSIFSSLSKLKSPSFFSDPKEQTLRICLLRQVYTSVGIGKRIQSSTLQQAAACRHKAISSTADSSSRPVRDQSWFTRTDENAAWGSAGLRGGLIVRSLPSWDGVWVRWGGDGRGELKDKRGAICKQLQKPEKYMSILGADSSWTVTTKYKKAYL